MLYPISELRPNSTEALVGFVDENGRIAVQPSYTGGSFFFEGKASVIDANGKSGFIDCHGNLKIPCRFEGLGRFKNGLCSINGGFIDHAGAWFISPRFLTASQFSEACAFASVDGESFGFIDFSGNFIIPPEFQQCREFSGGLAAVSRDDRWGYIDHIGELSIPLVFDGPCGHAFHNGLAGVKIDGAWGFVNSRGDFAIKPKFEDLKFFSEGYAPVRQNGKWGLINLEGISVVDFKFDELGVLDGGLAFAKLNGKAGFVSSTGAWTIQPEFDRCYPFFGMLAVVRKGKVYSYIRRNGQCVWTSEEGAKIQKPPIVI